MSTDGLGKTYGDREVVVREGDAGECMFAVQAGSLEVLRESGGSTVRVGLLQEGDIFGEMSLVESEPRSATVRALGEVRLLTIDKKTFLRRLQEDPSIAFNLTRLLCARVRRLNAEVANLKHAVGRGASTVRSGYETS